MYKIKFWKIQFRIYGVSSMEIYDISVKDIIDCFDVWVWAKDKDKKHLQNVDAFIFTGS